MEEKQLVLIKPEGQGLLAEITSRLVTQSGLSMSKIRFFRDSNPESKYGQRFESESESESFVGALQQSQSFNKPFRLMNFIELKTLIGIFDTLKYRWIWLGVELSRNQKMARLFVSW